MVICISFYSKKSARNRLAQFGSAELTALHPSALQESRARAKAGLRAKGCGFSSFSWEPTQGMAQSPDVCFGLDKC